MKIIELNLFCKPCLETLRLPLRISTVVKNTNDPDNSQEECFVPPNDPNHYIEIGEKKGEGKMFSSIKNNEDYKHKF